MLNRPMVEWRDVYDRMSLDQRQQVEREAAETAEKATRLSAYWSRRMSGGRHEDAVQRQNETAARVRQALGYAYKDAPITF